MVRSQKTRISRIVEPMMASRNWCAVCSTSGNSGIPYLSTSSQSRSRVGIGHLQKQQIRKFGMTHEPAIESREVTIRETPSTWQVQRRCFLPNGCVAFYAFRGDCQAEVAYHR